MSFRKAAVWSVDLTAVQLRKRKRRQRFLFGLSAEVTALKYLMKRILVVCLFCSLLAALPACTNTTKGAATGSALGAAAGVGIAAISGGYLGYGALAGAGAGAIAGGILGHNQDAEEERNRQRYYEEEYRYERNRSRYNRNRKSDRYADDDYYYDD